MTHSSSQLRVEAYGRGVLEQPGDQPEVERPLIVLAIVLARELRQRADNRLPSESSAVPAAFADGVWRPSCRHPSSSDGLPAARRRRAQRRAFRSSSRQTAVRPVGDRGRRRPSVRRACPHSTIRPCSRTKMRSARRSVLMRLETMSVVRPCEGVLDRLLNLVLGLRRRPTRWRRRATGSADRAARPGRSPAVAAGRRKGSSPVRRSGSRSRPAFRG